MHDFEKVNNIIAKDKEDWLFDGFKIFDCDYCNTGDYHFFSIWFNDTNYPPEEGASHIMFESIYTHDIEDVDQYAGDAVCFYNDNTILLRRYEEGKGTVSYKLSKK